MQWISLALLSVVVGLAYSQDNYFQVRYFYPYQLESDKLLAGLTIDATTSLQAGGSRMTLKLDSLNLVKQHIRLEATGSGNLVLFDYTNKPGRDLDNRKQSFTAVGNFRIPEGGNLLKELGLTYVSEKESGTQGYHVQVINTHIKGNLASEWRWKLGYGLTSTSAANLSKQVNTFKGEVKGKLESIDLGLSGNVRLENPETDFNVKLEASSPLSEAETLSSNFRYDSTSGDEEGLSFSTTRLEPLTLTFSLKRNSKSFSWGVDGNYPVSELISLNTSYSGAVGTSTNQALGFSVRLREHLWSAQGQVDFDLTKDDKDWEPSYNFKLNGTYRVEPWNVSGRANLKVQPERTTASLSTSASWVQMPWSILVDLEFTFLDELAGNADLQILYSLTKSLSLNVGGSYRRVLVPTLDQEFSAALGLRFGF